MKSNKEIIKIVLEKFNFSELNPIQKQAIDKGLFDRKNIVVSAPTASGKTLCGVFAGLNSFFNRKGKMIYLCPLVALAQEHYSTFKEKFSDLGIKVALSVGDFDSSDPWLREYDWIVCSNEKADSLIRHSAEWIKEIDTIVVDEIHMLTDYSRGPTLEILLTRLKEIVPNAQIIALSATVSNVKELSDWLKAESVVSDWRPVKLYEGVCFDSTIHFFGKSKYELDSKLYQELAILKNVLNLKKQVLFFVSSRRNAESLAEKLSLYVKNHLTSEELFKLKKISTDVLSVLDMPTKQCKRLSKCIESGIAFHHAGLLSQQKKLVEDNFRNGLIKAVIATPTLAMGVNLPAFRVVIRDIKRFYSGLGARYIPVLDYKQLAGRAGRPQYDEFGESVLMAKSEDEANELVERFINSEPEEIQSKLALEPVLRMHVLALIASGFVDSIDKLHEFFRKTFYAYQYGDISGIDIRIERIINMLIEFGFIVKINERLIPTKLGRRVSELYIDPLTGNHFIKSLNAAAKKEISHFSYLQMMVDTLEMRPLLSVREKDVERIEEVLAKNENKFLSDVPEEWDEKYDDFIRTVKTALFFDDWINESSEDDLLSKYGVTPGELRTRLTNADWLLYSACELALLINHKELLKDLRKLRVRIKHGVKEELLPLIKLHSVGRVRARKLFSHNLKSLEDLRKVPIETLSRIVGPAIANSIKKQLGENEEIKEEKQSTLKF